MQTAEAQFHDDYLALAKRLFTARAVDAAHRALKKALVCAPESTAGVSLLGNIRLANGGEKMALAAFHRAVLLDGYRDPRAWMNYGNALLVVDDGPRAVDAYRTVLRLDPEHVMAKTQLAVWYLKADMGDLARPYGIDLMARPDLPPRAALALADALRAFGAPDNARRFYARAICPIPTICRAAYFGRAMALRQPEAPTAAIMDFRRASILNPSDEETARELAGFALHSKVERAATWGIRALCYGIPMRAYQSSSLTSPWPATTPRRQSIIYRRWWRRSPRRRQPRSRKLRCFACGTTYRVSRPWPTPCPCRRKPRRGSGTTFYWR